LRFDVESADASEKAFGRLAKLKSTEVDALLRPPAVAQEDIDDAPKLTPAQLRKANAAGKTPEQALAEAVGAGEPQPRQDWPFPETEGGGPDAKSEPPAKGAKSRRGAGAAA
jgi:hypothetical protein